MVVGRMPEFADTTSAAQRNLFTRLVKRAALCSDGIWFGTPYNVAQEWRSGALAAQMPKMQHEHLLLYGKLDYWISREHLVHMAKTLPNARLEMFPYVGHSMCIELPLLFAQIFSDYFREDGAMHGRPDDNRGLLQ